MQKDAAKLLSSLKKTPKKSKKPKGPVVSKKKSVTFRKTHIEEEEVVEEEEESEIEVSPPYKVSLITIAYINDVDFFNYTYLLDLNSPECLTWAQFNTNITDAVDTYIQMESPHRGLRAPLLFCFWYRAQRNPIRYNIKVVRHNGNKSLTIKAFYTTVGPQPVKALVAQGPGGPAKVGRPKKKSAEPIVSRPYNQTSEDEAKQAFLNNLRLLTAPRQPGDGRGNSTTDDLIRSLNRQKEAKAGGIIALNRQLADQHVCSSESCPNYRKSCFKATPDSPHIFITRPDREMWAKQDKEKARAKVEKERETAALLAFIAQPIIMPPFMMGAMMPPSPWAMLAPWGPPVPSSQPTPLPVSSRSSSHRRHRDSDPSPAPKRHKSHSSRPPRDHLVIESRYEEEELPQRRGGSRGTGFLDMTSVRNSSPLRDDIAINTQLEAFGAYLAVHLPPNRQARAPAVVVTFIAKEYSLDDLRTLTPSDEVPASLL
ncbi:hypothetical protein DL95DRAFT_400322 [Leptodontidium sp. 2 PMI_412]|nr:hypothetical protein DL95DRAFT_400322 [Leptodontidium sp. 2 PMI_412]